jgi:predicted dehydrogenase
MRLCPLTLEIRKIIDSGKIGNVEQIIGYEDTPGEVYFSTWFRNHKKTGGMFMQKAVHDIDYMLFLSGSRPAEVCAMRAQRVFGGDKPFDLSCDQCNEQEKCPESPYNYFHERGTADSVESAMRYRYGRRMCRFSEGIKIDDMNECIIELENGAHIAHSQNFMVRNAASRRGARIYGAKGTIEMDFSGKIKVMSHIREQVEEIQVQQGHLSHYGGDGELVFDFLKTMKTGQRSRTDLIEGDGIYSTLACLCARESADTRSFIKVRF